MTRWLVDLLTCCRKRSSALFPRKFLNIENGRGLLMLSRKGLFVSLTTSLTQFNLKKEKKMITIEIPNWLLEPELWRYVGFASSAVGLLCYALSSSFNYLFGDWNLVKIFLYTVLSFIICGTILFADKFQRSASLQFQAHLTVSVLTLTSVYSFFSDEAMEGKPDAFSLVSCASFAIMSLSLSRQTHFGFEVDLLQFFLGCFILQLMKIKWLLFLVGAGFSYSLIVLRSSLDSNLQDGSFRLQDPHHVVIQMDGSSNAVVLVDSQQDDTASTLMTQQFNGSSNADVLVDSQQADTASAPIIHQFMACIEALQQNNSNLVDTLLKKAQEYAPRWEEEDQIPGTQLVTDDNILLDALPSETINDLHENAKRMVAGGFGKECSHVYSNFRREFLEESLSRLGLQKLSIEDVHEIPWQDFEDEIKRWIKASNVALRILFPSERRLCDLVFFGFSSAADLSFMEVCRGSTIQLLSFAEAVAIGSSSPERLFRILDVFETLRDLIPECESLFSDQYSVSLRNEAITIWKRLGEAIRGIFTELENLIRRDPAKEAVPGGGLHPITRYVMNYLQSACRSRQTLEQVFEDYGHPLREYPKIDDRVASTSSLSVQMAGIMEVLESNLEEKSKIYKDPALSYVFMMNNGWYIVRKAKERDSELGVLLGDDWIRKHTAKVRQYHVHYQRSSWNKVLGFLKLDINGLVALNSARKSMKEKIKLFNMHFEEICRVQSTWFVFDEQLREEIRISLENILLPAYGNFIRWFQNVPEPSKHAGKYIKYGMEDIEARLNDLFQGRSGSTGSRK